LQYIASTFDFCYLIEIEFRRFYKRFGYLLVHCLQRVLEHAGYNNIDQQVLKQLTKYYIYYQKHGASLDRF
jgi:hypothetical protein